MYGFIDILIIGLRILGFKFLKGKLFLFRKINIIAKTYEAQLLYVYLQHIQDNRPFPYKARPRGLGSRVPLG